MLSCFHSRPGELRTAEFNKISVHLLPRTPVNCSILSSYRELTVRSCQCDVFTGCAVRLSGFHLGHTESTCMEVLLDLLSSQRTTELKLHYLSSPQCDFFDVFFCEYGGSVCILAGSIGELLHCSTGSPEGVYTPL